LIIISITVIALIVVILGVVGAGMHQLSEEKRLANESWQSTKPTTAPASTKPVDPAQTASDEEIAGPQIDSIELLPKEAHLHGELQVIARGNGTDRGRGVFGFMLMSPEGAERMRRRAALRGNANLSYLTGLNSANDWAEWEIDVPKPGNYEIDLTYACPDWEEGGNFVIKIGDKELSLTAESTRSELNFRVFTIGRLQLPAGKAVFTIRPTPNSTKARPFMNLRGVQLIPAS
jgi:hypothetical protein